MYLTPEEEKVYDGKEGWARQVCMKILVRLGDLYGATRLIPVKSAHISGVSYKTLGDAPIDFLEDLVKAGGKAQVPATLNPSSFDPDYLIKRFSLERQEKQQYILALYKKMGVKPVLTCTPYYLDEPQPGWHLAWSESSATVYANSVLGAKTNREGGPSALAAALIGKTPDYGLHQIENRQPNVLVKVETPLANEAEFGALGIYMGKLLEDKIPVFEGLSNCSNEDLKQLGAGLASSGMVSLFYYKKPAETIELDKISVEKKAIKNTIENLSTASPSKTPDLIFIGCPHCSFNELKNVATAIKGRKVKDKTELWVCTSQRIKEKAWNHVNQIEKSGGHVLCDTCAVVTWVKQLGINSIVTNSAKTAHYAPTLNKVDVTLTPLSQCIEFACGC